MRMRQSVQCVQCAMCNQCNVSNVQGGNQCKWRCNNCCGTYNTSHRRLTGTLTRMHVHCAHIWTQHPYATRMHARYHTDSTVVPPPCLTALTSNCPPPPSPHLCSPRSDAENGKAAYLMSTRSDSGGSRTLVITRANAGGCL